MVGLPVAGRIRRSPGAKSTGRSSVRVEGRGWPPLVAGLEQAVVDELVEAVGGQGAADADGGGGVVAADGAAALGHVAGTGPGGGGRQAGEAGELLVEVVLVLVWWPIPPF